MSTLSCMVWPYWSKRFSRPLIEVARFLPLDSCTSNGRTIPARTRHPQRPPLQSRARGNISDARAGAATGLGTAVFIGTQSATSHG